MMQFQSGISARMHGVIALWMALLPLYVLTGCGSPGNEADEPGIDTTTRIALRDAIGEEIVLRKPAARVMALAPNLTEMIYAVGGGSTVVGRSTYCDYPPEALTVEPMGDMLTLNYEKILGAKPDLVLMTFAGNNYASYRKLKEIGLNAFVLKDSTVGGVIAAIDTVGMLLGRDTEATRLTTQIRRTVDSIRTIAHAPGTRPISTFIVIDKAPLMSASGGFVVESIEIAGGENIAKGGTTAYPLYSREELLRRDPEVILVPGTSREVVNEILKLYPEWASMRAVREGRVYVLPPDVILRPGPRIGRVIELLYKALHGAHPDSLLQEAMQGSTGSTGMGR